MEEIWHFFSQSSNSRNCIEPKVFITIFSITSHSSLFCGKLAKTAPPPRPNLFLFYYQFLNLPPQLFNRNSYRFFPLPMRAKRPTHLIPDDTINLKCFGNCKALKTLLKNFLRRDVISLTDSDVSLSILQFMTLRHWEDEDSVFRLYTYISMQIFV
jgi:hypothetical protein